MALLTLAAQTKPSTPSAGSATLFVDSTAKIPCCLDDTGRVAAWSQNASIAAMGAGFASDTYVTDSGIIIPSFGLQVRTSITWAIVAAKTGAGTATPIYVVRTGANKTTGDTARLTLTGPAQTAIADTGTLYLTVTVDSIGAAGVVRGTAFWSHTGTAANTTTSGTGFANNSTGHIVGVSAGFDMTALGGQYIGLSINGGASASWTVTQVTVEAAW